MYLCFTKRSTVWCIMFDNESLETYLQISGVITQAELPVVGGQGRLGEFAVAYRVFRNKQGGGFGNTSKRPYAWAILVYVDGLPLRLNSARGDRREWSTLDSVSDWMRNNGFMYWWTRNDMEVRAPEVPAAAEVPQCQQIDPVDPSMVEAGIAPDFSGEAASAGNTIAAESLSSEVVQPAYAYGDYATAYLEGTAYAGLAAVEAYPLAQGSNDQLTEEQETEEQPQVSDAEQTDIEGNQDAQQCADQEKSPL